MVCVSDFCRATHLHSVPAEGENLCRIFCDSLEVRRQQIQLCFFARHFVARRQLFSDTWRLDSHLNFGRSTIHLGQQEGGTSAKFSGTVCRHAEPADLTLFLAHFFVARSQLLPDI